MKRLVVTSLFTFAALGCAQEITLENQRADITSIGPVSVDSRGFVVVPFTLRDAEGDDQAVVAEACAVDSNGELSDCGAAEKAPGSDPMDRLPTVPADSDVPHEFRWNQWCGRWVGSTLEPGTLDARYVVGLTLLASDDDPLYSEEFSPGDLGLQEEGECP